MKKYRKRMRPSAQADGRKKNARIIGRFLYGSVEISLQETLEACAVARLVLCHFVHNLSKNIILFPLFQIVA